MARISISRELANNYRYWWLAQKKIYMPYLYLNQDKGTPCMNKPNSIQMAIQHSVYPPVKYENMSVVNSCSY